MVLSTHTLLERALPGLTTTTTAAATTAATTAVTTATTVTGSDGSATVVTTTAAVAATQTTSSYTTPVMLVPPLNNNPYLLRSSLKDGTVFIAFGAVLGFIFVAFVAYFVVRLLMARKNTRFTAGREKDFYNMYLHEAMGGGGGGAGSYQKVMGSPSRSTTNVLRIPFAHHANPSEVHSSLGLPLLVNQPVSQAPLIHQADVTRMFVLPTADLMNYKRHGHTRLMATLGSSTSVNNHSNPNLVVLPQRPPALVLSRLDLLPQGRSVNKHKRQAPSTYLESLFDSLIAEEK